MKVQLIVALLTTAAALFIWPAAAGVCDSYGNTPTNTNPCIFNATSGYVVRQCVGRSGICGIQLTYNVTNACNSSTQQAMLELQRSGTAACKCSLPLQDALAKAPSLVQPDATDVVNPFRGVSASVLSAATDATSCFNGISNLRVVTSSKDRLLEELNGQTSVKSLNGENTYNVIMLPTVTVLEYQRFAAFLFQCAVGTSSVSQIVGVPAACTTYVEWFSMFATPTIRAALTSANEVLDAAASAISELQYQLSKMMPQLKACPSPDPWNRFLRGAANESWNLLCDDAASCYSNVLSDTWSSLQQLVQSVNGTHPALPQMQLLNSTAGDMFSKLRAVSCSNTRKMSDANFRKNAMIRAMWVVLEGAGYTRKDIARVDFYEIGPRILSDILSEVVSLPSLQRLEAPAAALSDLAARLQVSVDDAISEYQSRFSRALRSVSAGQDTLLSMLPSNTGPRLCSDGSIMKRCPLDNCVGSQGVDDSGGPTNSLCPSHLRCVTDGCKNCQATCAQPPPSISDLTYALDILSSWLDLLRSNKDLQDAADNLKEFMPQVTAAVQLLAMHVSSPGDGPDQPAKGFDAERGGAGGALVLVLWGVARLQGALASVLREVMMLVIVRVSADMLVKMDRLIASAAGVWWFEKENGWRA
eukprot:gene7750-7949_t